MNSDPKRNFVISAVSVVVFLVLDLIDMILCVLYGVLDRFFEGKPSPCYCRNMGDEKAEGLSESLCQRKSLFRDVGFHGFLGKFDDSRENDGVARWSDCGCDSCVSWMNNNGDLKLHVCILDHSQETTKNSCEKQARGKENVLFLHGFLSSSSFWTETVFPNLSEHLKQSHKLFAVDLLGFGRSPKPRICFYTLKEHIEIIEKSVIRPFQLDSFHLVAHSMGCVVATALAAKYPNSVKSITLVAPPFFPSKEAGSLQVLKKLAEKRLWPPILFGSAVMSWYEHVGRSVCFLVCRNHRALEKIVKLVTRRRDVHFMIMDFTRHTHHSAWHTMHNVICGGSKFMESYLRVLAEALVKICVVQGDRDQVVPIECGENFKTVVPDAQVDFVGNADHTSIVLGRQREFTRYLEHIWLSVAEKQNIIALRK